MERRGEGGYAHVLWCHSCSSTPRIVSLIPPNRFFRLNKLFAPSKAADFFPNTSQSERTTTTTITTAAISRIKSFFYVWNRGLYGNASFSPGLPLSLSLSLVYFSFCFFTAQLTRLLFERSGEKGEAKECKWHFIKIESRVKLIYTLETKFFFFFLLSFFFLVAEKSRTFVLYYIYRSGRCIGYLFFLFFLFFNPFTPSFFSIFSPSSLTSPSSLSFFQRRRILISISPVIRNMKRPLYNKYRRSN